jgi:hypothetical protein
MAETDQNGNEKCISVYLELYKQQMERFHQTQEIEWKANIALWTLLAGAIYLAKDHNLGVPKCFVYFAATGIVLLHCCWLVKVQSSEHIDKVLWMRYRSDALALLRPGKCPRKHETEADDRGWTPLWLLLEVGMTTILAALLAFLATRI